MKSVFDFSKSYTGTIHENDKDIPCTLTFNGNDFVFSVISEDQLKSRDHRQPFNFSGFISTDRGIWRFKALDAIQTSNSYYWSSFSRQELTAESLIVSYERNDIQLSGFRQVNVVYDQLSEIGIFIDVNFSPKNTKKFTIKQDFEELQLLTDDQLKITLNNPYSWSLKPSKRVKFSVSFEPFIMFQVFRCPSDSCPAAFSAPYHSDRKLFIYYFTDEPGKEQVFPLPAVDRKELEDLVPDCVLHPEKRADYPHYEDFDTVINDIEAVYGEKLGEAFMEEFSAIQKTKSGGYPSFTQGSFYPTCSCGEVKQFFFQLSSDDTVDGPKSLNGDDWSPHGIMIGDVGNIYYYVCRSCGESSIETYWDCY